MSDHDQKTVRVDRPIVLVGLMGVGKTTVGRRLANRLGLDFFDADEEISRAAGCSVQEIFDHYGEQEFRRGERQVIARLLSGAPMVLATGGGAFIQDETRALIKQQAISVWLDAALPTLIERTGRRKTRPLLKKGDPAKILKALAAERNPIYAEADIRVESARGPHEEVVRRIIAALTQAEHAAV